MCASVSDGIRDMLHLPYLSLGLAPSSCTFLHSGLLFHNSDSSYHMQGKVHIRDCACGTFAHVRRLILRPVMVGLPGCSPRGLLHSLSLEVSHVSLLSHLYQFCGPAYFYG